MGSGSSDEGGSMEWSPDVDELNEYFFTDYCQYCRDFDESETDPEDRDVPLGTLGGVKYENL